LILNQKPIHGLLTLVLSRWTVKSNKKKENQGMTLAKTMVFKNHGFALVLNK
jgi:hypothetical protein